MSVVELAILGLQGATLVGTLALLLQRASARPKRPPVHVDVPHDERGGASLGAWGRARIDGWDEAGRVGGLRVAIEGTARAYEIWALTRAGWVQLIADQDRWDAPLLEGEAVRAIRLWLDRDGVAPNTRPARNAAPMLVAAALVLGRPGEPRRPTSLRPTDLRVPAERWASDVLIGGLLEEWTDACLAASRTGWVLGLPTGEALLQAWAQAGTAGDGPPSLSFARWLVGELGKATRAGLRDRPALDRREPATRLLFAAAGRLLRGIDDALELDASPPAGVGPRQRESWLVDEALARAVDNAPVHGVVQPVVVLRPRLRHRGVTVLEGEVA